MPGCISSMLATLPALQLLFPGKASGVFNVQGFSKEALQVTWVSPLSTDGPLVYLATAEAGLVSKVWFSSLGHARSGQTSCPELGCILRGISYTDTSLGFTAF